MTQKLKVVNKRDSSRFFIIEFDDPLIQAPSIIPQLILSLCTISIATCKKRFEIMMPFNGDKIRLRLTVKAGSKTFLWLFDTEAAVPCINRQSLKWPSKTLNQKRFPNYNVVFCIRGQNVSPRSVLMWIYG
jgi:hypothetical protein